MRRRTLLVGSALAALTGCAGPAAQVSSAGVNASGYHGAWLTTPYELPDASFTDTSGQPFPLRSGTQRPAMLIFFGYTNCPDICKTTLSDLASALNRVGAETRDKVQVVVITVDPARDTPEVLGNYLARFDPSFIGLTADVDTIKQVAAAVGVVVEIEDGKPAGEVTHSTQVIGFDRERRGRVVWTQGTTIGAYVDDLVRFAKAA